MNIKERVRKEMEKFIIESYQDMIDKNIFSSIYDIENYQFGQYKLNLNWNNYIRVYKDDITEYFPIYEIEKYRKTFLRIPYGKELANKILTKVGEKIKEYNDAMKDWEELQKNKNLIDFLPEDIKKDIKRKKILKKIAKDDNKSE